MADLTKEELEILEELREANAQRERIPPSERRPVTNPEKYSFPIGIGDDGEPFENPEQEEEPR